MNEEKATAVVEALRARGVMAHLESGGVYEFGVRVVLPGGREARWDSDGTSALDAEILQDGDLVGFIPAVGGSEELTVAQTVEIIAAADYDAPPG
ncbi:MAG: hypothetical protein ACYDAQ_04845 [Mycobacteriales bacterium]